MMKKKYSVPELTTVHLKRALQMPEPSRAPNSIRRYARPAADDHIANGCYAQPDSDDYIAVTSKSLLSHSLIFAQNKKAPLYKTNSGASFKSVPIAAQLCLLKADLDC